MITATAVSPATQSLIGQADAALAKFKHVEAVGSPRDLVVARIELKRAYDALQNRRVDARTVTEVKKALAGKFIPMGAVVQVQEKAISLPEISLAKRIETVQTPTGKRMSVVDDDPRDLAAYQTAKREFERLRAGGNQKAALPAYRRLCEAARKIGMAPPQLADNEQSTPAAEAKLARHLGALAAVPKRPEAWFSK